MKSLIVLLLILASSFAFAGPEDHMYETCYSTSESLPTGIPATFCFDDAYLKTDLNILQIDGIYSNIPKILIATSLRKNTEKSYQFSATANIVNVWESGCGEGVTANLIISGETDLNGFINPKALKLNVNLEATNDTCHSLPQNFKIDYFLSK